MSARTAVTRLITSRRVRGLARRWRAAQRRISGRNRTLTAFLEPGEPYSDLLADVLPSFADRYGLDLVALEVGPPEPGAAPEPERLAAYSKRDAAALREAYGIKPADKPLSPQGDAEANAARRRRLGHYASGMVHFEGEWYWGVDRLHHLERRLGAADNALLFAPLEPPEGRTGGRFEIFFSLRSPYSYIAMMRAPELAERWGAEMVLRPVLPMVMRALPVPREKQLYIVRDAKREAERFGLPFGDICDPVGAGVERGLAILHREIENGRGVRFAQAFLSQVWSQGVDAATDTGMKRIVEAAGLDWSEAQDAMADESWRAVVETNRRALFDLGLWGVPSFRVGAHSAFGQDRLWQVGRWLADGSDPEGAADKPEGADAGQAGEQG